MGGFRGFGDQALEVKQNKRQAAVQREQIAASERASRRSAGVQMANLNEDARRTDMADARAGEQLAATEADRAANRTLQREELAQRGVLHREDLAAGQADRADNRALHRESLSQSRAQHADDLAFKSAEDARQERQLAMNESTFTRMQEEVAKQKEVRDEWAREDTAMELAVMRAAAVLKPGEKLDPAWADKLNMFRGLKPGDPGHIQFITGVSDPKTGARYGVGYRKTGDDGNPVDTIRAPEEFLPKLRASLPPDKWIETSAAILNGQTSKMADGYSAIATRENRLHMQQAQFQKDREKALAGEQTRLETSLTDKTMLRDDVAKTKERIAKIAGIREGMLGLDAQQAAPSAGNGDAAAPGTGDEQPAAPSEGGNKTIQIGAKRKLSNGQTATYIGHGKWKVDN